MKIGVRIKLDVTKINKADLFNGKKGTYLDATTFINVDEVDQYDNNGMITQDTRKDAPDDERGAILGNVQVFWRDDQTNSQQVQPQTTGATQAKSSGDFDDDIPF
jgi:hypothetical protein